MRWPKRRPRPPPLRRRLGAVALFYPVFAVQANAGLIVIAAHIAVFVGFVLLGLWGFATGSAILAGALILHGLFDVVAHFAGAPGPAWWPAMCGALDVTAGALVLFYLTKNKVTP